jgi:predicted dinucleotide-binding enzyme
MKKIGILGTGVVGATIGKKLIQLDYEVKMGSRNKGNEKALTWVKSQNERASEGTFTDAAQFGDIIFLCAKGSSTLDALRLAGTENFKGKTVVDVSNALDFSKGMPPTLFISNDNSLGEEVQKLIPEAHVVKTLNMVNNGIMTEPKKTGEQGTMFICGNSAQAKEEIQEVLWQFGWTDIIDLGDITNARGIEMLLPAWIRLMVALKTPDFAFKVVRNNT